MMRENNIFLWGSILLFGPIFYVTLWLSLQRNDVDEQVYATAIALALYGKPILRYAFWPQAPAYFWVGLGLSKVLTLMGSSLGPIQLTKVLSALLHTMGAVAFGALVTKSTSKRWFGLVGVVLFAFDDHLLNLGLLGTPNVLAGTAFWASAYVLSIRKSWPWLGLAGLLAALTFGAKLSYLPGTLLLAYLAYKQGGLKPWLVGLGLASTLVWGPWLLSSPQLLGGQLVTYHQWYMAQSLSEVGLSFWQQLLLNLEVMLFALSSRAVYVLLCILFYLTYRQGLWKDLSWRMQQLPWLVLLMAYMGSSLLAMPMYKQYLGMQSGVAWFAGLVLLSQLLSEARVKVIVSLLLVSVLYRSLFMQFDTKTSLTDAWSALAQQPMKGIVVHTDAPAEALRQGMMPSAYSTTGVFGAKLSKQQWAALGIDTLGVK